MKKEQRFIHESALVETKRVGERTRIWRNVHVLPGAVIGSRCNIGEGCYVENHVRIGSGVTIKNNVAIWDNVTIEDDVFVGPAAVFTNDRRPRAGIKKKSTDLVGTLIKKGATIGANATIMCGLTIHEFAFVGAGSVVTKDVPAHHMVRGNPARFQGLVCRCASPIPPGVKSYRCECGLEWMINGVLIRDVD